MKKGAAIDSVLFSRPGYNALGEPYKPVVQGLGTRKENRPKQIAVGNEKPFKPQSHVKHPVKSSYSHMTDYVEIQKNFRSDENPREVISAPRNI